MTTRGQPAGDFDYDQHGARYATIRRPDPRIGARVRAALGASHSVLNVGAGAGSYEPADLYVLAVEPSAVMRAQRPAGAAPAIDAVAEHLPLDDGSFDAAMATMTVHQWSDVDQGLREMRRVSRGPVVVLTLDAPALQQFWLADYIPEVVAVEEARFPTLDQVTDALAQGSVEVRVDVVPIPRDCTDGFGEAFYARPEAFLDPEVRAVRSGPDRSGRGAARSRSPREGPNQRGLGSQVRTLALADRAPRRHSARHRQHLADSLHPHAASRPSCGARKPTGYRSRRLRVKNLQRGGRCGMDVLRWRRRAYALRAQLNSLPAVQWFRDLPPLGRGRQRDHEVRVRDLDL